MGRRLRNASVQILFILYSCRSKRRIKALLPAEVS
jgi:hypothetical protein